MQDSGAVKELNRAQTGNAVKDFDTENKGNLL